MSDWLDELARQLPSDDDRARRHLWIRSVVDWLRGDDGQIAGVQARVSDLLAYFSAHPQAALALQRLWRQLDEDLDLAALLAQLGLDSRSMFLGEFSRRLVAKVLPVSPDTGDAVECFAWLFHHARDGIWLRALAPEQLQALGALLMPGPAQPHAAPGPSWQAVVLRALAHCLSQVSACGFHSDLRQRMSRQARATDGFNQLLPAFHALAQALQSGQSVAERLQDLRFLLVEAQWAGVSVYEHLEDNGISVEVLYQLRQLRQRVERAHALLDMLAGPRPEKAAMAAVTQWMAQARAGRGIRRLLSGSAQMLAARLAERSAETGDHYITRNASEYRQMLRQSAGGGALLAITAWLKFLLAGISLSLWWGGVAAGLNYAISFVAIYLLHFTVATKQPAMTAPAMVARLRVLDKPADVFRFVDEVAHLIRSQAAALAGNLGAVIPAVALISLGLMAAGGPGMIGAAKAQAVLAHHQLLGPSVLFACFTGVLLFASSLVGGWVENAFVLHRLDSALTHHPRLQAWLGHARAQRLAQWLRAHVSGLAANVSLGLMLGVVPVLFQFLGLPLEVRHVTLVAAQLTAAAVTLGPAVLSDPAFWSALLLVPLVGLCNLAVSFYLAFRLALKARSVSGVDRQRIGRALRLRLRRAPTSFLWPVAAARGPS